jgi:hypothetical protein
MLPNQRTSINLPRTLGARSTRAKLSQSGGLGACASLHSQPIHTTTLSQLIKLLGATEHETLSKTQLR